MHNDSVHGFDRTHIKGWDMQRFVCDLAQLASIVTGHPKCGHTV